MQYVTRLKQSITTLLYKAIPSFFTYYAVFACSLPMNEVEGAFFAICPRGLLTAICPKGQSAQRTVDRQFLTIRWPPSICTWPRRPGSSFCPWCSGTWWTGTCYWPPPACARRSWGGRGDCDNGLSSSTPRQLARTDGEPFSGKRKFQWKLARLAFFCIVKKSYNFMFKSNWSKSTYFLKYICLHVWIWKI